MYDSSTEIFIFANNSRKNCDSDFLLTLINQVLNCKMAVFTNVPAFVMLLFLCLEINLLPTTLAVVITCSLFRT